MLRSCVIPALLLSTAAIAGHKPSGIDQTAIDRSVKPGDGFDAYANGAWRRRVEIAPDRSSTGTGYEMFLVAERRNAAVIHDAIAAKAALGTPRQRIADYYAAFLDTAAIERRGLTQILPEIARIEAVQDTAALSAMLGRTMRTDTDPLNATSFHTENLFGLFVTQDLNHPDRTIPYLLQGGLGLPDRDYYLSDTADMRDLRTAYKAYIARLLGLAGVTGAAARAAQVFDLETKIAAAHVDLVAGQDVRTANNPWLRSDFAAKAPGIDWERYWRAADLPAQRDFIVWHPGAVKKLSALVAGEPLETWRAWLIFHRLNLAAFALPKAFDDAHFEFYGRTLTGTPIVRPRDTRAIAAVNEALGDDVGHLYVARYFSAASKARIEAMVTAILAAFDRRVAALDWMAPATKAEARRKIATLHVGIGYPDRWRDYAGLVVRADDPLGNSDRASLAEYRHQLAKIGKPVDRTEWWMTPQTINAINLPLQNALNFPAAILEAPAFDARVDSAANCGAIGAIIGHEISHSFDNLGADFDASGRLHNWWSPADLKRFEAAGAALVAQYDAYEVLPGLHLNGQQELGENIADTAGLAAAYDAYRHALGGAPAPVIDGLSGDQRFFLAFAQNWRTKARDKSLRARVATDVHAPPMWRVETVRNLDAWYEAFAVVPGETRYLSPAMRVHVW